MTMGSVLLLLVTFLKLEFRFVQGESLEAVSWKTDFKCAPEGKTHLRRRTFPHKLPRSQNYWRSHRSLRTQTARSVPCPRWRRIGPWWPCSAPDRPSGRTARWRWRARAVLHLKEEGRNSTFSALPLCGTAWKGLLLCVRVWMGRKLGHSIKL